jgi:gas vesicle protein
MSEKPVSDIGAEFRRLGEKLRQAFEAARDSAELKRLREELEEGVEMMAASIKRSADDFVESDTSQQIREEVKELGEKLRRGEVQSRIRQELLDVLRRVNADLDETIARWEASAEKPPEKGDETR